MGTRNLTMVIENAEPKIAQYGQWDGYPSGQGATVLEFLHSLHAQENGFEKFKQQLAKCRFTNADDQKERDEFLTSIGSKDGWMNDEQAQKYNARFVFDTRNHGAEILNLVLNAEENEIVLNDQSDFANDSLYCEYAYVIDLDKQVLECYEGFNKEPLDSTERFYKEDQTKI